MKIGKYKAPKYEVNAQVSDLTVSVAKVLAESFRAKGEEVSLKENFGITFKEDMNTTNSAGAYTTMLSKTLYSAAVENIKDIIGLVEVNTDMMNGKGFGAYKIPIDFPTVAYEVAEGQIINYFNEGVDSMVVTPRKVIVGTKITWELQKRGMDSMIMRALQKASRAVERKLASDIVNGLSVGAGLTQTGGTTYDNIINARAKVNGATYANGVAYGFMADKLAINVDEFAILQKTADWKSHVYRAIVKPGAEDAVNRETLMFNDLQIVETVFLTDSKYIVLDSKEAGILVKESDLETFEGRLPGSPDTEIIAMMSYVLAVPYSKAICRGTV